MMLVVKLLASKILDLERKCVECGVNHNIGSSLFYVGRLNLSFPNLRYIVITKFFVVLNPLASSFAD